MSEIITDKLTGKTSAGDVTITSEGGSATMQLQQGLAKAWLYAQQRTATVEVKNSLNVSSWSDDATGKSTTNFTNAMSDATYNIAASSSYNSTVGSTASGAEDIWSVSSSQIKHDTFYSASAGYYDCFWRPSIMQTPEFQGTHLWDRLCWAKENLRGLPVRLPCCL
jgi:hypothetical protein